MLVVMAAMPLSAQSIGEQLKQNTSFGGYVIGRVNGTTRQDADVKADMGVRLARAYVDTKIGDFAMKLQLHLSGSPLNKKENAIRLVDAWVEWQHWKEFRVKFGQFKRCFTFENPMHPWLLGEGTYAQLTDRLAGYNDRTGEHASNGRDFGLQLQGDLFTSKCDGHRWLHYQAGVYTGQGKRDMVFICRNNKAFGERLNEALAGLPELPITIYAELDPENEEYKSLLEIKGEED